jgi:hypothetical protein
MIEIPLGIFCGTLISYYFYTEFNSYNNNNELLKDEEISIYYLIYILKKEMKTLPKKSSLNLNEKNRLINYITNIINKIPENNIYFKYKLNNMIDYLKKS